MKKVLFLAITLFVALGAQAQGVKFERDLAPAKGLLSEKELAVRHEMCLNGSWDVQCVALPERWKGGKGIAPELPMPNGDAWEQVKLKVPSPLNVNNWGEGYRTGEGTDAPYRPSSVYYPSYPEHWNHARMAWLRRTVEIPESWQGMQLLLHFEAVAGECRVLVNGKEVGRNFDNHTPFDIDITEAVFDTKTSARLEEAIRSTKEGRRTKTKTEILVGLRHPHLFDKRHDDYRYMSAVYPTGSNTDGLLGIWQDVYLHAVPQVYVSDVFVQPFVDKDELTFSITLENRSGKDVKLNLDGIVEEWVNDAPRDGVTAAEPLSHLGGKAMEFGLGSVKVKAHSEMQYQASVKVNGRLRFWSPDTPYLYMFSLNAMKGGEKVDVKSARFGWRQLLIEGNNFILNGKKIQCFGDIQHPFSAYICSRRFAWAWYKMIKDFGGNAVRPHAQPWPRCYYDLADEMGIMVLDETGLFGSSIRANFEEEETWERCAEQLRRLIMRDRNHPSVIGWSAGNECFAIALLNKPPKEIADRWDRKLVELAQKTYQWDTTRQFVTLDGDRDMNGQLPVWSKHFGHNLNLGDLPKDLDKPLVVGEFGATYYGRPSQIYPFSGERTFESYEGRNEGLAIDLYQNVRQMAMPYVAYFSPSEVSWFGIEHLGLGYHDPSRLPRLTDGIFPAKAYEEGKPGYQYERIPPYVTTFNPCLDPELPVYKPLAMFDAYKAALSGEDREPFRDIQHPAKPTMPEVQFEACSLVGDVSPQLAQFLGHCGVTIARHTADTKSPRLVIIDATEATAETMAQLQQLPKGSLVVALAACGASQEFMASMPAKLTFEERSSTALEVNKQHSWCYGYELPDLYFGESDIDKNITKQNITGEILNSSETLFVPSRTNWDLFNNVAEHWKCAQVVLYEYLNREPSATFVTLPWNNATLALTTIDWRIDSPESTTFWKGLMNRMGVGVTDGKVFRKTTGEHEHDLLMDGPVD